MEHLPAAADVYAGFWRSVAGGMGSAFLLYVLVGLLAPMATVRRFFGG